MEDLIHKDISEDIIGAVMKVLNILKHEVGVMVMPNPTEFFNRGLRRWRG